MYEYLFERAAFNYRSEDKELAALIKKVKKYLNVIDCEDYDAFVYGDHAKWMAEDIARSFTQTIEQLNKVEDDVIGVMESLRSFYERTDKENAHSVRLMSLDQQIEYRYSMTEYLDQDLKMMATHLAQLFMAARDEPIQPGHLRLVM